MRRIGSSVAGLILLTFDLVAAFNSMMECQGIQMSTPAKRSSFPGPTAREMEVLRAILDEAKKAGVPLLVHWARTPPHTFRRATRSENSRPEKLPMSSCGMATRWKVTGTG